MKTDRATQLKIVEKMKENIEAGVYYLDGIQKYNVSRARWENSEVIAFELGEHRLRPETLDINGGKIPKPLPLSSLDDFKDYFFVDNSPSLYDCMAGEVIKRAGIRLVYETQEEAVEAARVLFGIEDHF